MQKNILICAVIVVSLIASIGLAQSDNPASGMQVDKNTFNDDIPATWCRNGLFTRSDLEFKLARIKGSKISRTYFYGDDDDCPNSENCRSKSYVIAGDEVITSNTYGNYTCVWYQPKKGDETVGWIKTADLLKRINKPEANWAGKWSYAGDEISIKPQKQKGIYKIYGTTTWQGLGDNVQVGEIDFTAVPSNNRMRMGDNDSEYDCRVQMQQLGRFLIVADNKNCGGANVNFDGVYQRK